MESIEFNKGAASSGSHNDEKKYVRVLCFLEPTMQEIKFTGSSVQGQYLLWSGCERYIPYIGKGHKIVLSVAC
jgi:hypothetical protein